MFMLIVIGLSGASTLTVGLHEASMTSPIKMIGMAFLFIVHMVVSGIGPKFLLKDAFRQREIAGFQTTTIVKGS